MKYSKVKKINYSLLAALLSLTSVNSFAFDDDKYPAEIEYKCHIELLGGLQTIHFISARNKSVNEIEQLLIGRKVVTTVSKNKLPIYKVVECTGLYDKFNEKTSNALDENVVR